MKRWQFWLAIFAVYFVGGMIEYSICGECDQYIDQSQSGGLVLLWVAQIIFAWYMVLLRARVGGLESALLGAWCFVPLAIFWFGIIPTGYHGSKEESDEMQEMWRDAQ